MALIQEHSIKINVDLPKGDVNAKMEVFYNPVMISNRNISILLINSVKNKAMKIADPLAGSGIRSLRFLKELNKNKIKSLLINDMKEKFEHTFQEFLKLNKISKKEQKKLILMNQEASLLLFQNKGFDYVDIDPFGTPNPFLSAAIAAISRGGILAITATDTAALSGTYPLVTRRKYWSTSLKNNYMMHEIGLRILIRKVQLYGVQFDKSLTPVLSYSKNHYFRIYFISEKGKEKCDKLLDQHQYLLFCPHCLNYKSSRYNQEVCACGHQFQFAGPLWVGKLFDAKLVLTMAKNNKFPEEQKFLDILSEESKKDVLGFYDLHEIARKLKINPPKIEEILKKTKGSRTHLTGTGVKTELSINQMKDMVQKI
ncbi:hypothetical protein J4444_00705 [Candidatus Woesearchaeota archaeon]|nr:hypothetical protein [Candidatus Woesearchaeota archaeon]